MAEALSNDLAQSLILDYPEEGEEDEGAGDKGGDWKPKLVAVPQSQLFHFTSPLSWVKVLKIEFEKPGASTSRTNLKKSGEEDDDEAVGEDCEDCDEARNEESPSTLTEFPIRTFELVFSSDMADLSSNLKVVYDKLAQYLAAVQFFL